ncbi:hypothetical protein K8T06_06410 [bacterium]|nr:hypothetical protein [bacterium]
MDLILAIETATLFGGVALFRGSKLLGKHRFDNEKPASERLIPLIDQI